MYTTARDLTDYLWSRADNTGAPAQKAVLSTTNSAYRYAVSRHELSAEELTILAEDNLDDETLDLVVNSYTGGLTSIDEVRILAEKETMDRRLRRLLIASGRTYSNTTCEQLHDLCLSLDACDGLDDVILGVLPYWVAERFPFDVNALLPKVGAVAAAQMLASTGPSLLSDEEVWDWIMDPPERWHHEERKWHQQRHVRDALSMVLTHRQNLVPTAATDPDLVSYAMNTPHWEADYANHIRGIDMATGTLTDEASSNTPGTLLSLVWNPKTPVEQAEKIVQIAEEGVANTPFTDDWEITRNASERRLEVQPWHVDDFATVAEPEVHERLAKRIHAGFKKSAKDASKTINGQLQDHLIWWPKRFAEYAALRNNPNHLVKHVNLEGQVPGTLPEGTWTFRQFENDTNLPELRLDTSLLPPITLSVNRAVIRIVQQAIQDYSELPEQEEQLAWSMLLDLVADSEDSAPPVNIVDTVRAVLA